MKICSECGTRYPFNTRLCANDAEPLDVEDPPLDALVGGRYKLLSILGRGGMGIVYLAEHRALGKKVALKFLRGALADDAVVLKRFQREARAASAIDHTGIVDVTDFGDDLEWGVYFTMEYVAGGALSDMLEERGVLSPAEIIHIGAETADALAAAHEAGITHRDLKPDNIMLLRKPGKPPMPKIMDFGIAGMVDEGGPRLTMTGSVFGTPQYMSPEQAMGKDVDHRSDIYTLGVIIYEMAAGTRPFAAADMLSMLEMHRSTIPPPPTVHNQGIPPGLEKTILRCLEKDPADRFQSMSELSQALQMGGELGGETMLPSPSMQSMPAVPAVPSAPGVPAEFDPSSLPPGPPPGASAAAAAVQGPITTGLSHGEVVPSPEAGGSAAGRGKQIAMAAALVLLGGGGAVFLLGTPETPSPARPVVKAVAAPAPAAQPAAPAAPAAPTAPVEDSAKAEAAAVEETAKAAAALQKAEAEKAAAEKVAAEKIAAEKAAAEAKKAEAAKPKPKKKRKKRKRKRRGRKLLGLD